MIIEKIAESVGLLANVFGIKTNSDKDTYSCNYIDNKIEQRTSEVTLWEGDELPGGNTYNLSDNIYNYRFAKIVGQWGNNFVIPIVQGNTNFYGGTNFPLGSRNRHVNIRNNSNNTGRWKQNKYHSI